MGLQLIFDIDPSWFVIFFGFLGAWAVLMLNRKRNGIQNNVKEQDYFAGAGLFSLVLRDVFATQTGLWHYIPWDWPVIL